MIISASRRTDIPSFYSKWFFNRIKEGYVLVRNPYNNKQVSKILINPDDTDAIVFWTKNPTKMFKNLNTLAIPHYFQFTMTNYNKDIEQNLNLTQTDKIIIFKQLVSILDRDKWNQGNKRVILRYDPIFLTDYYSIDFHLESFEKYLYYLKGYHEKCVISFLDYYKSMEKRMAQINIKPFTTDDKYYISKRMSDIAKKYNVELSTCCEDMNLKELNIHPNSCIDVNLINRVFNLNLSYKKDSNQRKTCECSQSVDIGVYNTCYHRCIYCYAMNKRIEINHNEVSPFLIGDLEKDDIITIRKERNKIRGIQKTLF